MNLYLMRHGIALSANDASVASDEERPLSAKGAKRLRRAAKGMRRLGLSFDALLTSPLTRARQTADIVAAALAAETLVEEIPDLSPEGTVEHLLFGLTRYQDRGDLLLVGHEPLMSAAAAHLLTGKSARGAMDIEFKKGALCRIEIDALPPPGPGKLHWFLTPKQLRAIGADG
ncbi:MAG TPA: phosphohistidine phosphatase SixA [Candidatus Binatia bacterium]|nr:phosphohistidine phosphatase SixA [Candidatus Binatia bacterium]